MLKRETTCCIVDKPFIKVALTEMHGKKFKIANGSPGNTGSLCTPVHVMFTNKYDTRLLCKIEDTEVYELLFCNQLISLPIPRAPLPKCAMNMADGALERTDVKVFNRTANKCWGSKLPVSSGTSQVDNFSVYRL